MKRDDLEAGSPPPDRSHAQIPFPIDRQPLLVDQEDRGACQPWALDRGGWGALMALCVSLCVADQLPCPTPSSCCLAPQIIHLLALQLAAPCLSPLTYTDPHPSPPFHPIHCHRRHDAVVIDPLAARGRAGDRFDSSRWALASLPAAAVGVCGSTQHEHQPCAARLLPRRRSCSRPPAAAPMPSFPPPPPLAAAAAGQRHTGHPPPRRRLPAGNGSRARWGCS